MEYLKACRDIRSMSHRAKLATLEIFDVAALAHHRVARPVVGGDVLAGGDSVSPRPGDDREAGRAGEGDPRPDVCARCLEEAGQLAPREGRGPMGGRFC